MTPRRYTPRRSHTFHSGPIIAFLLIASFGILFAGCGRTDIKGPEDVDSDEFTFTEEDVARFRELSDDGDSASSIILNTETGSDVLDIRDAASTSESSEPPVIDLSLVDTYKAVRSGPGATGENLYRVTNEFLNVRDQANVTAGNLHRLDNGDIVKLTELVNAAWAKIEYAPGKEGYVAMRYLSKVAS
ncbi:MAG TPA: SH3 domain-containing protein [Candidatus Peribacteraceae bacterium]|nr:SH3 domain-containing protein [Candidatus Peribacteraceae bacterium]